MPLPIIEQLEALVDLDAGEYRLSAWEVDFVDSVERHVRRGGALSAAQQAKISAVYDTVFIHGKRARR